ncbi:uncharacterized protein METZ01_LOCUS221219 [marine metagenome]|uniref:Uncharacterized protein n=1 Tax=marine metagenome TaxID=408172 RepID=A0A382G0S5_9ZZZZ
MIKVDDGKTAMKKAEVSPGGHLPVLPRTGVRTAAAHCVERLVKSLRGKISITYITRYSAHDQSSANSPLDQAEVGPQEPETTLPVLRCFDPTDDFIQLALEPVLYSV